MSNPTKLTRRAAVAGMGLTLAAGALAPSADAAQPQRDPFADIPVSGQAGPGLEAFDNAMRSIIDRHGLPGAALAIAKDGRLVFAKGYGWADVARSESVGPETLFGLASLSKTITAVAILKLVEQNRLRLTDRVFDLVKVQPPAGGRVADLPHGSRWWSSTRIPRSERTTTDYTRCKKQNSAHQGSFAGSTCRFCASSTPKEMPRTSRR